jgi:1L-myo-inositol 1-phosphate cytidylyltransferase
MSAVTEAVVLMAGAGSRLRAEGRPTLKPLVPILGRPLISYTLQALQRVGIETIYAVIGFQSDELRAAVEQIAPNELAVRFVENREWQKQNGVSVLAAQAQVRGPFLLTMSDHLFDGAILELLLRSGPPDQLHLAVDRKLGTIFDKDDAMKVQTRGDKIMTLGKDLRDYDAIDTGLFRCTRDLFTHLEKARERTGDCSLADGVRSLAAIGKARAIDIGAAWWQDVDTPEMFAHAERQLRARTAAAADEVQHQRC